VLDQELKSSKAFRSVRNTGVVDARLMQILRSDLPCTVARHGINVAAARSTAEAGHDSGADMARTVTPIW
jgi:hypothetical protein